MGDRSRGLPKPPKPGTYREPGSVKFLKTSNRNLTRNQELPGLLPGLLPGFYQEFLVQPVTKIAKPGTETETYFLVGTWFRPKYFGFGRPLVETQLVTIGCAITVPRMHSYCSSDAKLLFPGCGMTVLRMSLNKKAKPSC